jgi:hypothetical protein
MPKILLLLLCAASPAYGWWCEGHEVVAMIAAKHIGANAQAAVDMLLKKYPPAAERFCKDTPDNAMAIASTWADDVKRTEKTATWHYMDIPLGLKKGDPEMYCEPIGPAVNGGERPGCILSALRSNLNILHSKNESDEEKAAALRYLIHLVGDLHQPLHTTGNNDQGGNCTPVQFFAEPKIANLHSVWDGMILKKDLAAKHVTLPQLAAELDQRYQSKAASWTKQGPQFDKWAWEGHVVAQKVVYADLDPKPPVEAYIARPVCKVEAEKFGALHILVGDAYQAEAAPVVEEQLAKAGYRLAEILNDIWP